MRRLLLLLLAGCPLSEAPSPKPADNYAVEATVKSWTELGLELSVKCDPKLIRVITPDTTSFTHHCMAYPSGACVEPYRCAYSCLSGIRKNTIVISQSEQRPARNVAHEMVHWLAGCSLGDMDHGHHNKMLWQPSGELVNTNVEGRAKLRLP